MPLLSSNPEGILSLVLVMGCVNLSHVLGQTLSNTYLKGPIKVTSIQKPIPDKSSSRFDMLLQDPDSLNARYGISLSSDVGKCDVTDSLSSLKYLYPVQIHCIQRSFQTLTLNVGVDETVYQFCFQVRGKYDDTGKQISVVRVELVRKAPGTLSIHNGRMIRVSPDTVVCATQNSHLPSKKRVLSPFYLAERETTNEQYSEFLNEQPADSPFGKWIDTSHELSGIVRDSTDFHVQKGYEDYPVALVSWDGARAYSEWLAVKEELKEIRIPSHAEWLLAVSQNYAGNSQNVEKEDVRRVLPTTSTLHVSQSGRFYCLYGNVWEWGYDQAAIAGGIMPIFGGALSATPDTTRVEEIPKAVKSTHIGFRILVPIEGQTDRILKKSKQI